VQTLRDRILTLKESAVLSTVPGSGSSTRLTGRTSVSCKPGMRMVLVLGVSAGFHNRMIHPSPSSAFFQVSRTRLGSSISRKLYSDRDASEPHGLQLVLDPEFL